MRSTGYLLIAGVIVVVALGTLHAASANTTPSTPAVYKQLDGIRGCSEGRIVEISGGLSDDILVTIRCPRRSHQQ